MENQQEYATHYALAEYWLNEADQRQTVEAGRECLMAAHVHALLAIADAVRRHTELIGAGRSPAESTACRWGAETSADRS